MDWPTLQESVQGEDWLNELRENEGNPLTPDKDLGGPGNHWNDLYNCNAELWEEILYQLKRKGAEVPASVEKFASLFSHDEPIRDLEVEEDEEGLHMILAPDSVRRMAEADFNEIAELTRNLFPEFTQPDDDWGAFFPHIEFADRCDKLLIPYLEAWHTFLKESAMSGRAVLVFFE